MSLATEQDFVWSDALLLGYGPMDDTHKEFVETVLTMDSASDEGFCTALEAFIVHAEKHFSEEAEWMRSTGFPATDCHIDEHNAVLKSLYEVKEHLAKGGNVEAGRRLTAELKRWFPGHADYMDAALAQWMVKKRSGGAPVVLKRGIAKSEDGAQ